MIFMIWQTRVVRMLDQRETALNPPFLAKLVGVGCLNVKYLFDSFGTSTINLEI